jgi:microcystin degradation protein MlrC
MRRLTAYVAGSPVLATFRQRRRRCDLTFVLRALLERQIENAAIGCIWDPIAASVAIEAGLGARLDLRIGGKMGPMSGDPVDLHVTVTGIAPDAVHFK